MRMRVAVLSTTLAGCFYSGHTETVGVLLTAAELQHASAKAKEQVQTLVDPDDAAELRTLCSIVCAKDGVGSTPSCELVPLRKPALVGVEGGSLEKNLPHGTEPQQMAGGNPRVDPTPAGPAQAVRTSVAICTYTWMPVMGRLPAQALAHLTPSQPDKSDDSCGSRWRHRAADRQALAAHLGLSAQLEQAAAWAFEEIACCLRTHRAPNHLIGWAYRAAQDERRHAQATRKLAARYGAQALDRAAPPAAVLSLEALASHNAVEGITREALGASLAHLVARRARAASVRTVYRRIAREETNHAEFSWALHVWLMSRLDAPGRLRVERARREALQQLVHEPITAHSAVRFELGLTDAPASRHMALALAAQLEDSATQLLAS